MKPESDEEELEDAAEADKKTDVEKDHAEPAPAPEQKKNEVSVGNESSIVNASNGVSFLLSSHRTVICLKDLF